MPRLPATLRLLLATALLLPAACGEPRPVDQVTREPDNFLAGIDEDKPHPTREGFFRKEVLTRGYALEPWRVNVHTEPFRVSPFREMGQAPGVIQRFGGPERLHETLDEVQRRLYAA